MDEKDNLNSDDALNSSMFSGSEDGADSDANLDVEENQTEAPSKPEAKEEAPQEAPAQEEEPAQKADDVQPSASSAEPDNTPTEEKAEDSQEAPKQVKAESFIDTSSDEEEAQEETSDVVTVRPVKFKQFSATEPIRSIKKNLDIMQDVSMHVSVELGRTKSSIREVMELEKGSVVELDKIAGEQVEIYVNEKLVAKGEVIVIEDKFGVRITSTNINKNSVVTP